jgi:hypothetical protein
MISRALFISVLLACTPCFASPKLFDEKLELALPGPEYQDLRLAWSLEIELSKCQSLDDFNQRTLSNQALRIAEKNIKLRKLEKQKTRLLVGGFISGFLIASLTFSLSIWALSVL